MPAPEDDLTLLVDAARDAGQIALRYWKQDPVAWEKDDDAGPVTEADLAVNEALEKKLLSARPDYGWLSEESEADPSRLDAEYCFIIDPIDGTRSFIAGQDGFAHSLAVARGSQVIAAVVYLPARNMIYTAYEGGPALRDGQSIRPTAVSIQGATVLTYRAATEAGYWRDGKAPPFIREFRPSLAWRLCLAAEGRFDAALSLRTAWEWDIAAGSLIAERAGAIATDRNGGAMRFNSPKAMVDGLIVAGPRLHGEILDALTPEKAS
ncbi:3'(2'),5'-bisphosphate nucleotidase CysQ [Paracoccus sp. 11-3]|uniref:3'(2'),5'-bisphosphate nucleotidase CysQ n=1 Tax=Paracoccus amoyensis TaxID=2760093 RepID=A0A926GF97_9RHOB|nr:3'(2'),5'-bisphosphate nucleotidase CysQ [Paracoccus amoyensis]MBC9246274.1 3'(2'),5'-bisphosphate nucleotidase CysQ [Paracoccus amoyensis]